MKLYVLVRSDLTKSQQAVQACHAVAEFMKCDNKSWPNGTIVLLKIKNELELLDWNEKLKRDGHQPHLFFEPDLPGQTALACFDTTKKLESTLCELPLL